MPKAKGLTNKQKLFCKEYIVDLNGTQAAIRAGYSAKTAGAIGKENLEKPKIEAEINKLIVMRCERVELTADDVLREYELIGFSDIRNYFRVDEEGELFIKSFNDMPPEYSRVIESIQQDKFETYDKDGNVNTTRTRIKIKLWDKHKALEMAARHTGGFVEKKGLEFDEDKPLIIRWADPNGNGNGNGSKK